MTLTYRDPCDYPHVQLYDLLEGEVNAVWMFKSSAQYAGSTNTRLFHDWVGSPICEISDINLPEMRPAEFVLSRSDVFLTGYRTYVGADGFYNLDEHIGPEQRTTYLAKLLGPEQYQHELSGFASDNEKGLYLEFGERTVLEIDETVISLTSDEAPNYGSFLVRILPKIVMIAKLPQNLKVLVPEYFESLRPLLQLCGISPNRIVSQRVDCIYRLRHVLIPSITNPHFWLSDHTNSIYDDLRLRYGQRMDYQRKLFISRKNFKPFHGRVMQNESSVADCLESLGFTTVFPEHYSPAEQIKLFSSASHIIGASGSGMFNIVFCDPRCVVIDVESEPHWVQNHCRLFASRGIRYGIVEGEPVSRNFERHHQAFSVDLKRLRSIISSLPHLGDTFRAPVDSIS